MILKNNGSTSVDPLFFSLKAKLQEKNRLRFRSLPFYVVKLPNKLFNPVCGLELFEKVVELLTPH